MHLLSLSIFMSVLLINVILMIFFYDQKRILSQWKLTLLNHQHFITNGSMFTAKSSIKPPLSNKPPLFRGRKLISPPASPAPYYSLVNDKLYSSIMTVKLCEDWSRMVCSPTGSLDLHDLQLLVLKLSTLYWSSLWRTVTIVFAKLNKPPHLN